MKTLLLIVCATMVVSCKRATNIFAEGPVSTRTQQFAGFNSILVTGELSIELHKGEHSTIKISAHESVLPYIEAYVVDSVLCVKYKDGIVVDGDAKLTIEATTKSVSSLECRNWGNIICIDLPIDPTNRVLAPTLTLRSDSGGSMMLYGQVANLDVYATGGSDFGSDDLWVTDFANINLSGVSSCEFTLNGTVDATLTDHSTLEYLGRPTFRDVKISGDSKLIKLED